MPRSHRPASRRPCRHCGIRFIPRVSRQIYCGRRECFHQRRRVYMKRYMAQWKTRHADYWKTDRQYEYLRRWREAHPNYFRDWRRKHRK